MSGEVKRRSAAEWFLESFFQERNIKWMLALGVMIVFGSSLMLVMKQWDHWSPIWKTLTVIGYSASVFGCGELCYHRLGLRNTGTVMRTLTLLLLPLSFLAIHRIGETETGWLIRAEQLGLLVLDSMLTVFASRRIFSQFLRGSQPTLVASYVVLAVAGGVLSPMSPVVAPIVAILLWGVFAVGTIKTARQVFWLAEEHRLPRVCGFLPIIVLGTQFLTLFVLTCSGEIALPWLGLGCVLTALPVLFTTDAVAKVFQQRTGDLVRPLPWSIVLPLFVGLVLCFVGVGLSAIGFPRSLALAPAAGLSAVMMLLAARRTGHQAFVWAGLIVVSIAYQALPAYFQQTARMMVTSAATAVHEPRLPVAFYGLTWLPLILSATFASVIAARRGDRLIEVPARRFAMLVAGLLFAICFTHAKAIFPVSAVMTVLFGLQAVLFRKRGLLIGSAAAWIGLCLSLRIFLVSVCGIAITPPAHLLLMTIGAAVLLSVGSWIDRRSLVLTVQSNPKRERGRTQSNPKRERGRTQSNPKRERGRTFHETENSESCEAHSLADASGYLDDADASGYLDDAHASGYLDSTHSERPIYGIASVLLTIGLALHWLGFQFELWPHSAPQSVLLLNGVALAALLMAQAWKWPSRGLGELAWTFVAAGLVSVTNLWTNKLEPTLLLWSVWSLGIWTVGRISESIGTRNPFCDRLANALGRPAVRVSLVVLLMMTVISQSAFLLLQFWSGHVSAGITVWAPALLLLAWPLDAAWRFRQKWLTVLGCFGVLSFVAIALLGPTTVQYIPAALGSLAVLGVLAAGLRRNEESDVSNVLLGPMRAVMIAALAMLSVATLLSFAWPIRLAGAIAVVVLGIETTRRGERDQQSLIMAVGHWQLVMLVAKCAAPSLMVVSDVLSSAMTSAVLPVALTLAAGLSVIRLRPRDMIGHELLSLHCNAGFAAIGLSLITGLTLPSSAVTFGQVMAAMTTFLLLAITEVVLAVRRQRVDGIWMAQGLIGAAFVWLLLAGVIHVGNGFAMFGCMGAAVALTIASRVCARYPQTRFASEAFSLPANLLPLAAVLMGVARHVTGSNSTLGMNSLGLLLPAAFYFWQAMETTDDTEPQTLRRDRFVVSAIIVNVASALLCRELHWSDAQFFMIPAGLTMLWLVELLKREIPEGYRDPLRYAGALTILVSPTFHIVSGSWLHLISLMVCSVLVSLLAIGLRVRVLVYSGTAFLIADLIAMVIRGSIDHPNLLWIAGLGIGASVITLGAICENHRESLLSRLRLLTAELQSWE
ncbi:MAG: hypothetical protein ACKV2Q_18610 [Planctomycetaceae bacterium]